MSIIDSRSDEKTPSRPSPVAALAVVCVAVSIVALTLIAACSPSEVATEAWGGARGIFERNTRVKSYIVGSPGGDFSAKFGGYAMTASIQAVKSHSLVGTDSFRVSINSRYDEDFDEAGNTLALEVDSLLLFLPVTNDSIFPTIFATDAEKQRVEPVVVSGTLVGPVYRYDLIYLSDIHDWITLSFVVRLRDRETNEMIRRGFFEVPLHRQEKLKYYN